jgi:two-component system OmpR family response regulator
LEVVLEKRVFLVEDLQPMHGLMQDLLSFVGGVHVVATARTEAEALAWLERNALGWDLAIVDLVLAEGSGLDVIRKARQVRMDGNVVVFSSFLSPAVERHCMQLGADAVFEKSYTGPFIAWLNQRLHGAPANS